MKDLTGPELNALIDAFADSEKSFSQTDLLIEVLKTNNAAVNPRKVALLLLEDTGYLINLMMTRENLLNKFLIIINSCENFEKNLRLDILFNLLHILEKNSFANDLLSTMLKKAYTYSKSASISINPSLEIRIAQHLMSWNKYNASDAAEFYAKIKDYKNINSQAKTSVLAYVAKASKELDPSIDESIVAKLAELHL